METEAQRIINDHDEGECPDCGDPISTDIQSGEECKNCGHVFHDPLEIKIDGH